MKTLCILITSFLILSCSEPRKSVSLVGYWYGNPIINAEDNDLEKMKGRKFVSFRMPSGHFITKQVFTINNKPEWRIMYGFWRKHDNKYIVKNVASHTSTGAYGYSNCYMVTSESIILNLTETDFTYKSNKSHILYANKKLSNKEGEKEININDKFYKSMYQKLQEFETECKNKI